MMESEKAKVQRFYHNHRKGEIQMDMTGKHNAR